MVLGLGPGFGPCSLVLGATSFGPWSLVLALVLGPLSWLWSLVPGPGFGPWSRLGPRLMSISYPKLNLHNLTLVSPFGGSLTGELIIMTGELIIGGLGGVCLLIRPNREIVSFRALRCEAVRACVRGVSSTLGLPLGTFPAAAPPPAPPARCWAYF